MRHDFDAWSLLWGLVFGAVALIGLAGRLDGLWSDPDLWTPQVLVPAGLILVGLLIGGFASAMLRRRSRRDGRPDGARDTGDEVTTAS